MNLDSTISLPSSEDVELHVFGPGYGESLLIHTGQGRWLIVDSCRKAKAAAPAAIEWLEHIGVDPSQAVTHIIATHWHDDHIRGLGETLERCTNATFVCSNALLSKELLALTEDAAQPLMGHASGVDEIRRVVAELRRRKKDQSRKLVGLGLEYASADKRLHLQDQVVPTCEVWSLSPSSAEFELSLREFARMLREGPRNAAKPVVRPPKPNDTAVVLWVKVGERVLLLGADLEERRSNSASTPAVDCGWTAIVSSNAKPNAPAEVFKVAHHGSQTGHNEEIWTRLLGSDPLALLTPFRNGKCLLPNNHDKARILQLSGEAYISSPVSAKRYKPKERTVSWAYEGKQPTISRGMGHIYARTSAVDSTKNWEIQLFEGALPLANA